MALNNDIAYKFGCGRYIQEKDAIRKNLAGEVRRIGSRPLVIYGKTGRNVAGGRIASALEDAGICFAVTQFLSLPCYDSADRLVNIARENGCDVICGVGGGVIMDAAKLAAQRGGLGLIQIPTSSATCAAVTPLSVLYDPETHAYLGSLVLLREADAVIVDSEVLIRQPLRLFCSGIMDSEAKLIEITHRIQGKDEDDVQIGLQAAYDLSRTVYDEYEKNLDDVLDDMRAGKITPRFERAVFYAIGMTGVISGISKNSSQTALAHKLYEYSRTGYYAQTKDHLHGELVALGLIPQLAYNGLDFEKVRDKLIAMGLPSCFSEAGLPLEESVLEYFTDIFCRCPAVNDESPEEREKIRKALMTIYK